MSIKIIWSLLLKNLHLSIGNYLEMKQLHAVILAMAMLVHVANCKSLLCSNTKGLKGGKWGYSYRSKWDRNQQWQWLHEKIK